MNLREKNQKNALYVSAGDGYGKAPWHWWRHAPTVKRLKLHRSELMRFLQVDDRALPYGLLTEFESVTEGEQADGAALK